MHERRALDVPRRRRRTRRAAISGARRRWLPTLLLSGAVLAVAAAGCGGLAGPTTRRRAALGSTIASLALILLHVPSAVRPPVARPACSSRRGRSGRSDRSAWPLVCIAVPFLDYIASGRLPARDRHRRREIYGRSSVNIVALLAAFALVVRGPRVSPSRVRRAPPARRARPSSSTLAAARSAFGIPPLRERLADPVTRLFVLAMRRPLRDSRDVDGRAERADPEDGGGERRDRRQALRLRRLRRHHVRRSGRADGERLRSRRRSLVACRRPAARRDPRERRARRSAPCGSPAAIAARIRARGRERAALRRRGRLRGARARRFRSPSPREPWRSSVGRCTTSAGSSTATPRSASTGRSPSTAGRLGAARTAAGARGHLASAVVAGRLYAIGGQIRHDTDPVDLAAVDVYDHERDAWTAVARLPAPRSHFEAATFVDRGDRRSSVGATTPLDRSAAPGSRTSRATTRPATSGPSSRATDRPRVDAAHVIADRRRPRQARWEASRTGADVRRRTPPLTPLGGRSGGALSSVGSWPRPEQIRYGVEGGRPKRVQAVSRA